MRSPRTGRSQLHIIPKVHVDAVGVKAFDEIKAKQPLSQNPQAIQFVQCITDAILEANQDKITGTWEVRVFDSGAVNAFAVPGNKIGIYTGIIGLVDNADELATVIGHEIGHVLAQHGRERMSESLITKGVLSVGQAWDNGGEDKNAILDALGLGIQYGRVLPASRTQENEADKIGLVFMAKAGFDPKYAITLWEKMGKLSGGNEKPEFMSTHPSAASRARDLTAQQPEVLPLYQQAISSGRRPNCVKPS